MKETKFRFLLSNDDGYQAKGLHFLAEVMSQYGEVIVVAPDGARSGFSGSISLTQPLRLKLREEKKNIKIYSVNGTPADSVKLALFTLFSEEKPTMVLTGINHGSNDGVAVHYSGTLGSAREGAIVGCPALALSLDETSSDADFSTTRAYIEQVVSYMLEHLAEKPFYSLNFPSGAVKGLKVCPQAKSYFIKEFVASSDGMGKDVYWMTGTHVYNKNSEEQSDFEYMRAGFATLTPLTLDQTDYSELRKLQSLDI